MSMTLRELRTKFQEHPSDYEDRLQKAVDRGHDDEVLLATCCHLLGMRYNRTDRREAAVVELQKALLSFRKHECRAYIPAVLNDLGYALKSLLRLDELLVILEDCLPELNTAALGERGVLIYQDLAACYHRLGRNYEALEALRVGSTCITANTRHRVISGFTYARAIVVEAVGEHDEAYTIYEDCLTKAEAEGERELIHLCRWALVCNRHSVKDYGAALQWVQGLEDLIEPPHLAWKPAVVIMRALLEGHVHGASEEHVHIIDEHSQIVHQGTERELKGVADAAAAEIRMMLGRYAEALPLAERSAATYEAIPYVRVAVDAYDLVYECGIRLGDHETAMRALRRQLEISTRAAQREQKQLLNVDATLSKIQVIQQELNRTSRELSATLAQVSAQRDTLAHVETIVRKALDGDRPVSREMFEEVIRHLRRVELDEDLWMRFRSEFGAVHPQFQTALLAKAPGISPAELRVAMFLRAGLGTKDIARATGVSDRTIELHRSVIRRKLGLASGVSLVTALVALDGDSSQPS